jgi:purine-binding chemotaxis protein CheW
MQYVTFQVGELLCGADVNSVQEVLRHQMLTPVPLAAPVTPGLINLRGQILTAIDLRAVFNLPPLEADRASVCVIVQEHDSGGSLVADRIGEVLEVADEAIRETPSHWKGATRTYVRGVVDHKNELLLLLDAGRLLAIQGGTDDGAAEISGL